MRRRKKERREIKEKERKTELNNYKSYKEKNIFCN